MMTRLKQWLACLLSVALLMSALPAGALAEGQGVASEAVDLSGAFVRQRAAQEYPLDSGDFNLSAELTIDGQAPDENTVIHDGTAFNVRLEWELPAGETYTPEEHLYLYAARRHPCGRPQRLAEHQRQVQPGGY